MEQQEPVANDDVTTVSVAYKKTMWTTDNT